MKNLLNNILKTVFCLLLIIIGILIGKFYNFPYFEISKSIDLTNLFSISVTVGLAIIITVYFDKRKNDNRVEKDLILKRVDNIYEITNKLQKESVSGTIPYTEAASSIKRINTSLMSIYKTVEKCQFSIKDDIKKNLKTAISDLRDKLTDTPKISEELIQNSELPIEVKDGIIHFNKQRINQIESKFDVIKDCLFELEIRINKK
ncbi:hypothetical protein [Polaribacter gochangensis]|uniref:hypothetical protein n=1 Tax=Polaribacter gochangensis TaxID=3252903 RepID=UPI003904BCD5